MQQLILRSLLIATLGLAGSGCQSGEKNPVLAQVEDYQITAAQLREELKEAHPGRDWTEITLQERQQALQNLVDIYCKAVWGRQQGLDQDSQYQARLQRYADQKIAMAMVTERVTGQLIPEEKLRQYYDWYYTDVEAVIVKIGHENAGVRKDRTLQAALEMGEKFKRMLAFAHHPVETAKNLTEANPSGVLANPYRFGRIPPPGDSLIYCTPVGEVGGPVPTRDGVVLVRVLGRKLRDKDRTFEAAKDDLLRPLRWQIREEEQERFIEITEALRKKYRVVVHDEGIRKLSEAIAAWAKTSSRDMGKLVQSARDIALAEVNDTAITSDEFLRHYRTLLLQSPGMGTPEAIKERFVEQEVNLRCWVLEGRSAGIDRTPQHRQAVTEYAVRELAKLVDNRLASNEIVLTEEAARAYYEENREHYKRPERIEVWQIGVEDEATAREVLRRARAGESFEELHQQYVGKRKGKAGRFKLGFLSRNSLSREIVEAAFAAGPHQFTGPVKMDEYYYVIKTGAYEPETIRPFDEVKNTVFTAAKNKMREDQQRQFLEEIRREIAVKVNESALKALS